MKFGNNKKQKEIYYLGLEKLVDNDHEYNFENYLQNL